MNRINRNADLSESGGVAVLEPEVQQAQKIEPAEGVTPAEGTEKASAPAQTGPRQVTKEDNELFFRTFNDLYQSRKAMSKFGGECFEGIVTMTDEKQAEVVATFSRMITTARGEYQQFVAVHNGVGKVVEGVTLNKSVAKRVLGLGGETTKQIKDAFKSALAAIGVTFKA